MGLFGRRKKRTIDNETIRYNKKVYHEAFDFETWPDPEKTFYLKVAGVTFVNEDTDTERQFIIEFTPIGEHLMLIAEDDNPYDEFAVRVVRWDGLALGYLPSEYNRSVWQQLSQGRFYDAVLDQKPFHNGIYGAMLKITRYGEKKNDVQKN